MNRRDFIKNASILTLPIILKSCDWPADKENYLVEVCSDANTGHLLLKSHSYRTIEAEPIDVLIVGGGIAGLSAACQLRDQEFMLCELSGSLGGSSSAQQFEQVSFAQGAHYDYAYPSEYGNEALALLEKLDIVEYLPWNKTYSFRDAQHIISHRRKSQSYKDGKIHSHVITDPVSREHLARLVTEYTGKMPMPTRIIDPSLHFLNEITFKDFLTERMPVTEEFLHELDYHMKDDYGAGCPTVSALAGIHYFACRPYYAENVELFSPPEGNYYFIDKMSRYVGSDRLKTKHLVSAIKAHDAGFEAKIIDIENEVVKSIQTKKIVYAGQKHALKYIYPEAFTLFQSNIYAPWMVVSVVVKGNELPVPAYWQNEMISDDPTFLGFTDSFAQHTDSPYRVLNGYYCLPASSRKDLINADTNKNEIARNTVKLISKFFDKNIEAAVKAVYIKVMGHAMPIPTPGYLFNDKNTARPNQNIAFAGVDNARLPLLFEAIDSGIHAVKLLGL